MKCRVAVLGALVLAACICSGCVERKLLIRSDPPGAPVWLDEKPLGAAPVEVPFKYYGVSRLRVGPIRDAQGRVQRPAVERMVDIAAPWYEEFPVDFFSEVLWPGTLRDDHRNFLRHFHAELLGIIRRPARGRDLDDATVVEGALRRIEFRIFPDRDQLGVANRVAPGRVGNVDRAADRG